MNRTLRMKAGLVSLVLALTSALVTLGAGASAGAAMPTCKGFPATIVGTEGPDRIEGTPARDVIVGGAGKDVIFGRDGNDVICGGAGNDVIKGGRGNDYAEGNQGNDKLIGGIGRDTLDGGNAKDRLFGGGGPDTLIGGGKRDIVFGEVGTDTCDLDRFDFYVGCERGDVLGVTGFGSVIFETFDAEGTDLTQLDDFVLNVDRELDDPPNAGFPSFIVEFYFDADPSEPDVALIGEDLFTDLQSFFVSTEQSGLIRLAVLEAPGTVEVVGTEYFEWLVVHPDLLARRVLPTSDTLPDVFRLAEPLAGPLEYELTFDPEGDAFVEFFPGPIGETTFDGSFGDDGPLTGTVPDGVWAVAVEAQDWTLTLGPVG